MAFLKTTYEKKSFWTTTIILLGVLLLLFFAGLRYMEPPVENGILIALGTPDVGSGIAVSPSVQEQPEVPLAPEENTLVVDKAVPQEQAVEPPQTKETPEEVLTTEESDVVVPEAVTETAPEPIPEPVSEETKEAPQEASATTKAALANILGAKEAKGSGVGNSTQEANQGLSDGALYASSFYGSSSGDPSGMGFGLAGRSLAAKGAVTPDCEEEGRVVVAIEVNRSGEVVAADPGVKGSTNIAPCLLKPAKATALMYRWAPDNKAPERQIGFVVINFKLGGQQ